MAVAPRATPCAPSSCAGRARRAPATPRASRAAPSASKEITSVGSSATHSAIAGSPVKVAMSPRNVPASASATQTSLPGLRSSTRTRPRSMTRNGASRWPCSYSVSPGRERTARAELREPLELLRGHAREHDLVAEVGEALGADLRGCGLPSTATLVYEGVAESRRPVGVPVGHSRRSMKSLTLARPRMGRTGAGYERRARRRGRPPARRDARAGRASRGRRRPPRGRCAPIGCQSHRSGR